jgi:ribosome biogenesis GTPase / thiamine phosphate phosphatase
VSATTLDAYGWSPRWAALVADEPSAARPGAEPGRVIRHDGIAVLVATPSGTRQLPWRGGLDPAPIVGDWVVATAEVVEAVLPRSSLLRRQDPRAEIEQPLVANLDAVLITCGADRPIRIGRVQRAAAVAWDAGAVPVIVLTKADLADDIDELVAQLEAAAVDAEVVVTSAVEGTGLDAVRAAVADRTVVLLGESGAGKSTLANALIGEEVAATGRTRGGDAKGRHTTTSRQLHPLPTGGVLVDTPGIRSVGLWTEGDEVPVDFDDVDAIAATCRFSDCAHAGEPGCAVAAAVESGELSAERFAHWQAMEREAQAAALRATEHERRAHGRRFARITKDAVKRKGRPD